MEDKPLLNDSEGKRPTLLYIIIAVLAVAVIALIIVVAVKKCDECSDCPTNEQDKIPYDTTHFIPINQSFYPDKDGGSHELQGQLNHFDSPYFKMVDVYNMKSNDNRTILSKFKTYQQTSEYSAHCACIIMTLTYYGDEPPSERDCMNYFGVTDPNNFEPNEEFYQNMVMKKFEEYINSLGYTTTSNDNYTEENFPFEETNQFTPWVKEILKKNETILVTWSDWGGTTSLIIGVDNMGHESAEDHVILLADAYDTCDHLNDGYTIMGLDKFFYNWQYNDISYSSGKIREKGGKFIVIHRKE